MTSVNPILQPTAVEASRPNNVIISGVVMMVLATLNNVFVGSTPAWYWVLDLAIYIPFCLLGYKLSLRSKQQMRTDQ